MESSKGSNPSIEPNMIKKNNIVSRLMKQKEMPIFLALFILCVVLSLSSEFFLTSKNILNVLRQFSVIAILAVGQALIIITGGIDLSVGSLVGLMGVITAVLAGLGLPAWVIFIAVILAGCIAGSINGLFVTKVRINPFIVTLGMLSIAKGVALLITGGMPISIENPITYLGSVVDYG